MHRSPVSIPLSVDGLKKHEPARTSSDHPSEALRELRCHAAAAAEGWNDYPDWTPVIEAAGFAVTKSDVTTAAPVTPAAREYAQQWFARFPHLAALTADDRDALEELAGRSSDNLD